MVRASTYVFWGGQNSLMTEDKQLSLSYCQWQIPFNLFLRLCFFYPYYMESPLPLWISKRHSFSKKVYPKPTFPRNSIPAPFSSSLSTSMEPCLSSQACIFYHWRLVCLGIPWLELKKYDKQVMTWHNVNHCLNKTWVWTVAEGGTVRWECDLKSLLKPGLTLVHHVEVRTREELRIQSGIFKGDFRTGNWRRSFSYPRRIGWAPLYLLLNSWFSVPVTLLECISMEMGK